MLKAQLKSKIFQITPAWREIEDILTSDFFGTLDYLPRNPYLRYFISYIASLNPYVQTPPIDDVDWDNLKLIFWPRIYTDEERAEPDIVLISNKWILVVEVKLQSGLGDSQPWREYIVGQKIAENNAVSKDSVYYLVTARNRLDIATMFKPTEAQKLNELAARTSYLRWHEAVALIESWIKFGIGGRDLLPEHERMLTDLFNAMRKRRAIAFSGFAFVNIASTAIAGDSIFCPPRFTGFQYQTPETQPAEDTVFLSSCHAGFVARCPEVDFLERPVFLGNRFEGFVRNSQTITRTHDSVFFALRFTGFLKTVLTCRKYELVFKKGSSK